MRSNRNGLELLKNAALEAGALAMRFFRRNPSDLGRRPAARRSPRRTWRSTSFCARGFSPARPDYGWLSEETVDEPSRRARSTIFVVDPIDGTRGFIEGGDSWCVSLAVVEDGRPVAAGSNAPARDEIYVARRAAAAPGSANGRLAVSDRAELAGARLAGPRGWLRRPAARRKRLAPT